MFTVAFRLVTNTKGREKMKQPKTERNMYPEAKKTWNPFVGCLFDCVYCENSFKRQMKRRKNKCGLCYNFKPHTHPERFEQHLPKTSGKDFVFCCDMGDWAFCPHEMKKAIIQKMSGTPQTTFLLQSKSPVAFLTYKFPENVILGTTIETNNEMLYNGISKAAPLSARICLLRNVNHKRKEVTIEPIIDFAIDILTDWITSIGPEFVYVGYDSKQNFLPEPELEKTMLFIERLRENGLEVRTKLLRKAWWETE